MKTIVRELLETERQSAAKPQKYEEGSTTKIKSKKQL